MTWTAASRGRRGTAIGLRTRHARPSPLARALVVAAGSAAVACEVAYPLVHGGARDRLTVVTVVVFAAASLLHAAFWRGALAALVVAVAAGGAGFGAEVLGLRTGFPFGEYAYAPTLGPEALGVPLVIPCAYVMLGYPTLVVARRLTASRWRQVVAGSWALAAWDLFLDPQMVAAGHWSWRHPDPHLPGVPGVPLTNAAGWLLVATVVMVLLLAVPERRGADDRVPITLWLWTWLSSVLALAVFLHLPWAAVWGGVGMGVVGVPLLARVAAVPPP